jgi:hypothetical protein
VWRQSERWINLSLAQVIYIIKRDYTLVLCTLYTAQKIRGKRIYAYSEKEKLLVNNVLFIRETSKFLLVSASSLTKKLDTDIPFKGYYYYSTPYIF